MRTWFGVASSYIGRNLCENMVWSGEHNLRQKEHVPEWQTVCMDIICWRGNMTLYCVDIICVSGQSFGVVNNY